MKRWESRYSSCEMMYLEVHDKEVRCYLNRYSGRADRYTFEEVKAGAMDNEVGAVFGHEILSEVKALVCGNDQANHHSSIIEDVPGTE